MKSKLTVTLACSVALSAVLFGATGYSKPAQQQNAAADTAARSYLIAFTGSLPANYGDTIAKAGGQVVRAMPELGGLEVRSADPGFLTNLKSVKGIQAANLELSHKLTDGLSEPAAADGQPVTDIPQDSPTFWPYQWDMQRLTHNGDSYKLETGGTTLPDGTVKHKAVVGVIDSGIDSNHPDLKRNFLGGMNFVPAGVDDSEKGDPADIRDREGHGTHVAGSIAANGRLKGVGPDLGIRSYRVFPEAGSAPTSWITAAIVQAANDKVDVINMSIGGFDAISRYTFQGEGSYSDVADLLLWKRAVRYAVDHNVTVVAAAGNETLNLSNPTDITDYMNAAYGDLGLTFRGASKEVPGQTPGVITVSSSIKWSTDQIAFYSNYGASAIDVAAPGGDNGPVYAATGDLSKRDFHFRSLSTYPTYLAPYFTSNLTGYALMHGTSMASPKVAGIAALVKAAHPDFNPSQVAARIRQTSLDYGKPGQDALFGSGEANAYTALK
ncbi:peptidase [Gordoniibacillus kamchatkensis]|uniref:Peptidase n=1 Tax=Gordoniibacillus kamchatkensis TaxID=1590651 RepID=A0ABR5ALV0_9BACL|nr:S8 family serine peptidase [Paenibacillus sp. VKM B-2647]KIL41500.1 peptidase [Paenibacillus sp. VKM B-2647]